MKPSQDKPLADRSKVSSAHPSTADKKGSPSGSSPARGICANGIDTNGEVSGYEHTANVGGECRNRFGIGEGDGGPTIDKIDSSNPGDAL